MKEIESGETKKFVLVRIHKGTIEPIDYVINGDGTFTASSDKYSDFIWLIVDEEGCAGGNHDLGEFFQSAAPTCTPDGEMRKECSRCDYAETQIIPASHMDENSDKLCDECEADLGTVCSDCDRPTHDDSFVQNLICFIFMLFKLIKTAF